MTTRERTALEVEVSRALENVERVVSMLDEDPAKALSSSSACLLESLVSKCDRLRESHRLVLQQQQQAPEEDPIIPVTEDEENTTIAALLLDDDDDDDDSVVATSRNLVTPLPPKRCCKRASNLFSEDDFAVQIKKMCALEDHFATQRTKRRRRRDDDPKPKCRRLPSEDSATEEEEEDEEDDDDEPDQPEESSSQTPPVVIETTQSEEQTSGGGRQVADAALGKLGLLPPEVTLALLSQLNGSDLGRLECCCRTTRGSQGIVEFAVLHVKRHQYGVTQMPLLKRETYPHLVCRWEWTRTSKSFSTRTDEVAAALQSLDFLNRHPTVTPLPAVVPPAAPTEHPTTTTQAAVLADNSTV